MTISAAVYGRLKAVTAVTDKVGSSSSARIFPAGTAPKSADYPFIIYSIISGEHSHHTGPSGFKGSGLARKRVQVDCIHTDANSCEQLAEAVREALDAFRGTVSGTVIRSSMLIDDQFSSDPAGDGSERHNYRYILDFDIWYVESVP